jgi:hydrogenase expression/formation protein HypC
MCLGIPGEVVELRDDNGILYGKVKFAGVVREVCLACVPEVAPGDFVLVHVGFAISRIDAAEAERQFAVLRELEEAGR